MIRVLHIDDEAPIRLLARVNLEAARMEVIEAADGRKGLRLARRVQPDVILLNVNLPALDGWRVAEELLQDRYTSDIPIVFLTARTAFEDRARGLHIGAIDYITKPFNPVDLASRLRALLARLERGEWDKLRREKIARLPPLTLLARALQAQGAKMPEIPLEALAPTKQHADAIAEMQRLVAQLLESRRPLLSEYVARDLLGRVSTLPLPTPIIDLEQERAVDQAADDMRADPSAGAFSGVDHGTRGFLRDLPAREHRNIREKLAPLILAIANYVLNDLSEKTSGRKLVRLVTVLYVLMGLYYAVSRVVDAAEHEDEGTKT